MSDVSTRSLRWRHRPVGAGSVLSNLKIGTYLRETYLTAPAGGCSPAEQIHVSRVSGSPRSIMRGPAGIDPSSSPGAGAPSAFVSPLKGRAATILFRDARMTIGPADAPFDGSGRSRIASAPPKRFTVRSRAK